MTLTEVLAARAGCHRSEKLPVPRRPLITPTDDRGQALPTGQVQLRAEGDPVLDGHATVYDVGYDMYGGPDRGGWTEHIVSGAGAKSLSENPDVVFLINHQGEPLGRTTSGTMDLAEDGTGLRNVVRLNADDPTVQGLVPKIERGDMTEQSFAFRIVRQEWDEAYTERWITEFSIDRGDTSIVTFGANPHTSAHLRSADLLVAELLSIDPAAVISELAANPTLDLRQIWLRLGDLIDETGAPDERREDRLSLTEARTLI
ncbi:MAG TPA: HK97 family phage prohead protease [Acidimicrobiales bacterium]|nr:HK97 family phage prohead protease [Acidimicrobiales bacterium]